MAELAQQTQRWENPTEAMPPLTAIQLTPTTRPDFDTLSESAARRGCCHWGEGEREGMRWFRENVRFGSRLALFALAVQIVLTFGHVHGLTPALAKSAPAALANQSNGLLPNSPNPLHKSNGSADFDCPICALIQLASTSVPSVAPALPVPAMFVVFRPETPIELELAASSFFSFQARAPPAI